MSDALRKVKLELANTPGGKSSQPQDEEDEWTPKGGISPPLDLDALAHLTQIAPIRRSCIIAVVHNTVGLGIETRIRKGHEEDVDEDDGDALLSHLDSLARRDHVLHRPNFARLLEAAVWDRQECGNGAIEVSRNRLTGQIDGLFHVEGKRVRRRTDRSGWIMGRRGDSGMGAKTYFYNFGDKVQYAADGTPTNTLKAGRTWATNELIPLQLFTSESRDYGLPPDSQLALDYLGDKLAAEQNVGFFQNGGVPPTVIFVSGTESEDGGKVRIEVGPELAGQIADTMRSGGRVGRVAIVPVPPGAEINKEDLAVLSERDMGFVEYRRDNRRRTLAAWRLSPVFVADIEDAGKYTAEVERAITKEQVFDPEQTSIEDVLNETIIREIAPAMLLDFSELRIKSDEAERESANDLADRGLATREEVRGAHGKGPLPEPAEGAEPKPGEVPQGWNAELVPARSAAAPLVVDPDDPDAPRTAEIRKAAAGDLASGLASEFDLAVSEALDRVHEMADGADVVPLVVKRGDDGAITISEFREDVEPAPA